MNTPRSALSSALAALVLAALAAAPEIRAANSDARTERFTVSPGGRVVLEADRGSVVLTGTDTSELVIEVRREVRRASAEQAEKILSEHQLNFAQDGDTVRVGAKSKEKWKWRRPQLNVEFRILAPRQFNADLKTAGGSVTVDNLEGAVELKTAGGSLRVQAVKGSVKGQTAGGSITVKDVEGDVAMKTAGGGITVEDTRGAQVAVDTSGGSIRLAQVAGAMKAATSGGSIDAVGVTGSLEASTSGGSISASFKEAPANALRLRTNGGSVTLKVPDQSGLNVDAETSGGGVSTDLPVQREGAAKRNALKGQLNGGGVPAVLRTSGGSIRLQGL